MLRFELPCALVGCFFTNFPILPRWCFQSFGCAWSWLVQRAPHTRELPAAGGGGQRAVSQEPAWLAASLGVFALLCVFLV